MGSVVKQNSNDYWRYAIFAAPLAAVGIPIYIYAPKFLVDHYGLSLWHVGAMFLFLRLIDVIQDPFLGKIAQKIGKYRRNSVLIFIVMLCFSVWFFFAVDPLFEPLVYSGLCLLIMFTAFSYLNICFYSQGLILVESKSINTHEGLAAWRETGALIGIVTACLLPTFFQTFGMDPWGGFAVSLVIMLTISNFIMRNCWTHVPKIRSQVKVLSFLRDSKTRSFLFLAFLNASPVAITSTLFLFFVETRLGAANFSGIFLLTFFISAAVSVPLWGKLTTYYELRQLLSIGMLLAVVTFGFTSFLSSGDIFPFIIICGLSGASLGADMSILPAMYASHISRVGFESSIAFGLWSFFNKVTLAVSAGVILPILAMTGFVSGEREVEGQFFNLNFFYCLLPCSLKLLALIALQYGPFERKNS